MRVLSCAENDLSVKGLWCEDFVFLIDLRLDTGMRRQKDSRFSILWQRLYANINMLSNRGSF